MLSDAVAPPNARPGLVMRVNMVPPPVSDTLNAVKIRKDFPEQWIFETFDFNDDDGLVWGMFLSVMSELFSRVFTFFFVLLHNNIHFSLLFTQ